MEIDDEYVSVILEALDYASDARAEDAAGHRRRPYGEADAECCDAASALYDEVASHICKALTMPKPSSDMLAALKRAARAIDYGQAQVESESDRKFLVGQLKSVKKSIRILEREYEDHRSR